MKKTTTPNLIKFEQEISDALLRSAELARKDAVRTNTGIVVSINNKVVTIPAKQLSTKLANVKY